MLNMVILALDDPQAKQNMNHNLKMSLSHSLCPHSATKQGSSSDSGAKSTKTWIQHATVSTDLGSPGVLTLTETCWPLSGPRQTIMALTFTLWQAVVSKTLHELQGLVLSWIDKTRGANFWKVRSVSSTYRSHRPTPTLFSYFEILFHR